MLGSRVWPWLSWVAVFVVATAVLRAGRDTVATVHALLAYLLVILGGSVSGGRPLGLTLTVAGFLSIDYFFQLPYDTLTVSKPLVASQYLDSQTACQEIHSPFSMWMLPSSSST